MKHQLIAVAVLVAESLFSPIDVIAQDGERERWDGVEFSAKISVVNSNECVMDMRLTNTGSNTYMIGSWELPWITQYGRLKIAMVVKRNFESIKEYILLRDPDSEYLRFYPDSFLEGSEDLYSRFDRISEILEHDDVVLFWLFETGDYESSNPADYQSGWILIPAYKTSKTVANTTNTIGLATSAPNSTNIPPVAPTNSTPAR